MRRSVWFILSLMLSLLFVASAAAQTKTEYSDKDKKKMADIAQRPEVALKIREAWDQVRRRDMQFAFNVNSSTKIAEMSPTSLAEFREKYGQLYDNPILLRYVNGLGQRLVPKGTPNLYAFRLLLDPMPKAEALSTGTIYISTGLVSLLDNEAQLSYIIGHEIAHVERNHAYNEIRNSILEEELDKEKEVDAQKKRTFFSLAAMAGGAAIGGAAGGMNGAMMGGLIGAAAGTTIAHFAFRNRFEPTEWSTVYENEADEAGFKYMLDQNYDVREIPRLYARLDSMVSKDQRVGLGFIGNPQRVKERISNVQTLLTVNYKADIDNRVKGSGLLGSSPEFALLMASLKRDNGVVALDYDLFAMARDNLEDAVRLRSNDPRSFYYLGQVTALTGRTAEEKQQAMGYFLKAIQYDAERGAYPEPHLEHALYLISQNDPSHQDEVKSELKSYVALYQREHGGAVPNNMHIIYDYFLLAGDTAWYVPPAATVTTKNVDALYVSTSAAPSTKAVDVLKYATEDAPAGQTNTQGLKPISAKPKPN